MAAQGGTSDVQQIGKDFLTCGLCLDYYKNAKTLPCLHSYCETCLDKLVEKTAELICPQCRKRFDCDNQDKAGQLGTNHMINGLVEFVKARNRQSDRATEGLKCEACDVTQATSRCMDCQVNFCYGCIRVHSVARSLRGHHVVSIQQYLESTPHVSNHRPSSFCNIKGHEMNEIQFYCDTCEVSNCLACTVVGHRVPEHRHREVTEAAKEFATKLEDRNEKLRPKENESNISCTQATQEMITIQELYEQQVTKVKQHVEHLIKKARSDEEKILTILKKEHDKRKKFLECEIDRYEMSEKNIRSTCSFIDALIQYGADGRQPKYPAAMKYPKTVAEL
ncbi:E3 ubiquitin-protein ligase TRIM56-like [Saccoglossus kowalevskii]|uniref:E3 ubiquitin-protein ligase TRIM56-like n=1 Tax=Saccoglossus kowalevskii TaxID=10224 RepID=A0ABM0M7Z4_SACKO|nr:PREDICTED: E3 ubiquitin-protein ligase TRIM56-like [Saccoglossus kowalevskii]